eukprot:COSAG01_NODE_43657_length_427_cov_1.734756_2_plen_39_part_01
MLAAWLPAWVLAGWLISAADFSLLSAAWLFLFDKFDRAE